MSTVANLEDQSGIINDEVCAACSGAGTLICCESCPKSFHFICADPPIHPNDVPSEKWFCNNCSFKVHPVLRRRDSTLAINSIKQVWFQLIDVTEAMNPKIFFPPKKIRKIDLNQPPPPPKPSVEKPKRSKFSATASLYKLEDSSMLDGIEQEHSVADSIPDNRRGRLSMEGFCHACGKMYHSKDNQLLICCDQCSLRWHLDCLPYPLAVYPSSHRHWACPIHLTNDNLAHLPASTIDKIQEAIGRTSVQINGWPEDPLTTVSVLPETSVRLQFGWTLQGLAKTDQVRPTPSGCLIPEQVRAAYELMRKVSKRESKLHVYYQYFSYVDQSVETCDFKR